MSQMYDLAPFEQVKKTDLLFKRTNKYPKMFV
jgi:hypothetical protein